MLLVAACSRDRSESAADSMPPMDHARGMSDTATRGAYRPDSAPGGDTLTLTGSRITVERAVVNGILWGVSEEDARGVLGAPQSVTTVWEEALGDSSTVLQYPGLTLRTVEQRVVAVHCTATSCITSDAVRVGATRAEVEQVYGKAQVEGSGAAVLAYPFTTDDSCALRFELASGKVRAIDVSCQMN